MRIFQALSLSGRRTTFEPKWYAGQKQFGIVGVKMAGSAKSVVMISAESGTPVELASIPLSQATVRLKVDCSYPNKADKAHFYYSLDGQAWTTIGRPLQMYYSLDVFVGCRFALFNYFAKSAGGFVDFDYFRISNEIGAAVLK
jgi:xylan 1,4-beta-xylosidase